MTPQEAERIIAEKLYGWHRVTRAYHNDAFYNENDIFVCYMGEIPFSSDRNRLYEAEMRLEEEQRETYTIKIRHEYRGRIISRADADWCIRTVPPAVCAVAMAEVLKGE